MNPTRTFRWLGRIACSALVLPLLLGAAPDTAAKKRATMYQLFQSMRVLLPLTATRGALGDPANRKAVRSASKRLAENAGALAAHTRAEEPGARFLGRSIAQETRALEVDVQRERWGAVAFTLHELTRYCVACHSRLPSDPSPLAKGFVDATALASFSPPERARLQRATRQFDAALTTYETYFLDTNTHVAHMVVPMSDYMTTTLRVRNDAQRPLDTLKKVRARKDVWRNLAGDMDSWMGALKRFAKNPPRPTVAAARAILDEADDLVRYPADRRAVVHYIAASGALHRYLEKTPTGRGAAEAYLLLSRAEGRVDEGYWLDRTEAYLEACIREAPHSETAEACHAALEDQLMLAYAGTGTMGLPVEVEQRLQALWKQARRK
jgi:hypothetical protein